jgi:regulator of sigma E protease
VKIEVESVSYQIQNFHDVQQAVQENLGSQLTITVTGECDGVGCLDETNDFLVYARTEVETPEGQGSLGIIFQDVVLNFYPWYEMPFRGTWYGLKQAIGLGILIVQALGQMLIRLAQTGSVSRDVAGPIGIVHQAQQGNIISDDFWMNLGFAGMLSLNLAIINLLPIPALDGGRALFILFEKIFGQSKMKKIEIYANYVGFALLVTLIITITISDISRIING